MISIAQIVSTILHDDETALSAAKQGILNYSSYARRIQPAIEERLLKPVHVGSVTTAIARVVADLPTEVRTPPRKVVSLSVHSNLDSFTIERAEAHSQAIQDTYRQAVIDAHTFVAVTQGINEITVVADHDIATRFRSDLENANYIYDKQHVIGITVTFTLENLEIPNLIYSLTKKLADRNVNIIEVISTATELTFIVSQADLAVALEQLQKSFHPV